MNKNRFEHQHQHRWSTTSTSTSTTWSCWLIILCQRELTKLVISTKPWRLRIVPQCLQSLLFARWWLALRLQHYTGCFKQASKTSRNRNSCLRFCASPLESWLFGHSKETASDSRNPSWKWYRKALTSHAPLRYWSWTSFHQSTRSWYWHSDANIIF